MSLSEKFGIPASLLDAAKKTLAESDAYQQKVKAHMTKKGVKSLNDMTPEQKKKFFNELDAMHTAKHEEVEGVEEGSISGLDVYMDPKDGKVKKYPAKQGVAEEVEDMAEGDPGYNKHSFIGKIRRGREADDKGWEQLGKLFRADNEKDAKKALRKGNRYYNMIRGDNKTPGGFPKTTVDEQGVAEEVKAVEEGTGVTDYAPKSQGGTRKELLAKYHKSKNPKDAEAARKAGATQKELQGEEFESVEEELKGDMHPGAKKVLKHIKPEHHDKYKPYLKKGVYKGDYKDRAAVLSAAERAKHTNEGYVAEEEEQIDELSKETLTRYANTSASSARHNMAKTAGAKSSEEASKAGQTATKRLVGYHKALKKIGQKNEEFDLDDLSLEDIESFMQTEDYNQLDELSKNTLASYIKKRSHDVAAMGAVTRKHAMDSEAARKDQNYSQARKSDDKANKAFMKGWKHRQNIGKAVDKLTKEELEFIESLNAGTAKE